MKLHFIAKQKECKLTSWIGLQSSSNPISPVKRACLTEVNKQKEAAMHCGPTLPPLKYNLFQLYGNSFIVIVVWNLDKVNSFRHVIHF